MANINQKITIAIDGYSSCGKSTLAKALAEKLNYIFIDTGSMYRAVALFASQHSLIGESFFESQRLIENLDNIKLHFEINTDTQKPEIFLNNINVEQEIRTMKISNLVSQVAKIKEVRTKLVYEQRLIGTNGGIVMDGRDIGSVVFPNAELKLFITADPLVRAERRFKELQASNASVNLEEVVLNLKERDLMDSTREESPLIQTPDAVLIDNTNLNPEQQLNIVLEMVTKLTCTV